MSRSVALPWIVRHVPKRGHTADEYEDAWAAEAATGRFAVADGASESSFSGPWARHLTAAFVTARRPFDDAAWLAEPRRRWSATVDGLDLNWYAEMKREQGAHATFLGLSVRPPTVTEPGAWKAVAVGDSCVVRIRDGRRPLSFPLQKSTDFGNQPRLLCSRPGAAPTFDLTRGSCRPGDRLFLMTDALAQWFLERCEQGKRPWDDLHSVLTSSTHEADFEAWIADRRDRDGLRNDDVTLLAVGPIVPLSLE